MTDVPKPFLDFYGKNRIAPVTQDISDLQQHFQRREALYRHLRIPPLFVKNRSILEFGPGTGQNALFTNALQPARYVMVDGNPTSVEQCRGLFADTDVEVVDSSIEDFETDERFDLVLCEGLIPWQLEPMDFVRTVARFVAPGGILVVTCMDDVSILSEALRRIAGEILIDGIEGFEAQLDALRPFFAPQLATLKGMSRLVDDWISDNILHHIVGKLFSVEDAVEALEDEFGAYGSSPDFLTDWRWYKSIHGDARRYNEMAIGNYRRNAHNFLDYRFTFDPNESNNGLIQDARQVFHLATTIQNDGLTTERLAATVEVLNRLDATVAGFSPTTAAAITDFRASLMRHIETGSLPTTLPDFGPWFGRGMQYLSLIRNRLTEGSSGTGEMRR